MCQKPGPEIVLSPITSFNTQSNLRIITVISTTFRRSQRAESATCPSREVPSLRSSSPAATGGAGEHSQAARQWAGGWTELCRRGQPQGCSGRRKEALTCPDLDTPARDPAVGPCGSARRYCPLLPGPPRGEHGAAVARSRQAPLRSTLHARATPHPTPPAGATGSGRSALSALFLCSRPSPHSQSPASLPAPRSRGGRRAKQLRNLPPTARSGSGTRQRVAMVKDAGEALEGAGLSDRRCAPRVNKAGLTPPGLPW